MKISCQSCQAKYTIADEKVLGKIVKIRCKKCSATTVINGNEQAGAASQPLGATQDPGVYDYTQGGGGGEQWTVNVADGDQRTMTQGEIVDSYKQMVVNDETYCWKDGMSDWLPLREIEQLYSACTLGPRPSLSPEGSVPQMNAHMPQQDEQPTRVQETNLGQLFGGASPSSRPPAQHYSSPPAATNGNGAMYAAAGGGALASSGAAARRVGGRGGQGADLFGGVAQAGGEDDVMTSVAGSGMPAPHAGDGKLTGQRNENSVLFSLSALTNNAPKEEKSSAVGEGSGLIDIRALSASMETRPGPASGRADDIMNLAGGGAFTPALAAPVLAPPAMDGGGGFASIAPGSDQGRGNKTILLAGIGAFAFIVVGIIIAVAIVMSGKKDDGASTGGTPTATTAATTATTATATPTAAGTTTDTATAAPTGTAPPADTSTTQANKPPTNGNRPPPTAPTQANTNKPPTPTPTTAPAPTPKPPAAGGCGCAPGDVDCAIRCSVKRH